MNQFILSIITLIIRLFVSNIILVFALNPLGSSVTLRHLTYLNICVSNVEKRLQHQAADFSVKAKSFVMFILLPAVTAAPHRLQGRRSFSAIKPAKIKSNEIKSFSLT